MAASQASSAWFRLDYIFLCCDILSNKSNMAIGCSICSVVDPDPAFFVNGDPDADPDTDPGLWWPKIGKKSSSLKREHLSLKNLNYLHFCGSFWPSWIRIRIPNADPDPADQNECGSGSTTLVIWMTKEWIRSWKPIFWRKNPILFSFDFVILIYFLNLMLLFETVLLIHFILIVQKKISALS